MVHRRADLRAEAVVDQHSDAQRVVDGAADLREMRARETGELQLGARVADFHVVGASPKGALQGVIQRRLSSFAVHRVDPTSMLRNLAGAQP